jgi:hypothetical protein
MVGCRNTGACDKAHSGSLAVLRRARRCLRWLLGTGVKLLCQMVVLNSIFERLGVVVPGAMRWSGRRHAVECTERGDAAAVSQAPLSLLCFCLCDESALASTIGTSKVESGTPGVGDCDVQTFPSQRCLDWASGLKIS